MKLNSQITFIAWLILGVLFSTGCSSVMTKHPLSAQSKLIDKEKIEGVWLVEDDLFHVKFDSNSVAQIVGIGWGSNQFYMMRGEVILTEGDENNFASIRFQDEEGKWWDSYIFFPYTFSEQGDLILWLPKEDIFEEAIEKEELYGIIKREKYSSKITVTDSSSKLLSFIKAQGNLKLFQYTEPTVLRKIHD